VEPVTVNIYRFCELNARAKDRARDAFVETFGFKRSAEYMASLFALVKRFGASIDHYSVDWFEDAESFIRLNCPEMDREDIDEILATLGTYNPETLEGLGDCVLTGVSYDESAIDGFRKAFHAGETDLERLLKAAFDSWVKAGRIDCEYDYSDEGFSETADANEYRYFANGDLFTDEHLGKIVFNRANVEGEPCDDA